MLVRLITASDNLMMKDIAGPVVSTITHDAALGNDSSSDQFQAFHLRTRKDVIVRFPQPLFTRLPSSTSAAAPRAVFLSAVFRASAGPKPVLELPVVSEKEISADAGVRGGRCQQETSKYQAQREWFIGATNNECCKRSLIQSWSG